MSECCGKPCDTRFCPTCGKKLAADSPLESLMAHCQKQADSARRSAESCAKERDRSWAQASQERFERVHAKWQAWADAIADIL